MPIYAYKCSVCGHTKDVLQKISDDPLTVCPTCGQAAFSKQVTAAGFQLKGSGWYVTDFRDGASKPADTTKSTTTESSSASASGASSAASDSSGAAGASGSSATAPAATTAAPPATSTPAATSAASA